MQVLDNATDKSYQLFNELYELADFNNLYDLLENGNLGDLENEKIRQVFSKFSEAQKDELRGLISIILLTDTGVSVNPKSVSSKRKYFRVLSLIKDKVKNHAASKEKLFDDDFGAGVNEIMEWGNVENTRHLKGGEGAYNAGNSLYMLEVYKIVGEKDALVDAYDLMDYHKVGIDYLSSKIRKLILDLSFHEEEVDKNDLRDKDTKELLKSISAKVHGKEILAVAFLNVLVHFAVNSQFVYNKDVNLNLKFEFLEIYYKYLERLSQHDPAMADNISDKVLAVNNNVVDKRRTTNQLYLELNESNKDYIYKVAKSKGDVKKINKAISKVYESLGISGDDLKRSVVKDNKFLVESYVNNRNR
jgi:hypothetical protein